uniref:G-protein coupled receptors family 1 profile domain-containing protein n=1 Tax=Timema monikensis TaxID=170555 RepID=A0A7R9EL81_9NEOP|nr:unnamed protein product [Timema monikensis]
MEKKYTLIIENGSLHLIQDDPPSSALPSAFLVIVFTIGLCLNVFMVFSVCTCPSLRRKTFNLLLLQLCCACALDCLINMTSSLTILMALDMGILESGVKEAVTFCRVNAMFSQGIALLEGVLVAVIAAERALLMKGIKVEQVGKPNFDAAVKWGLPLLVWVYPLILVLPIGVTSRMVGVRPFANRYSCGIVRCSTPVGQPQDLVYPSLLGALGYIIPWVITVTSICSMACHVSSVKRRQRQLEEASRQRNSQRNSSYLHSSSFGSTWSQVLGPTNSSLPLWEEARCYLLLTVIIVTYLVLVVPHVFTISVPSFCPGILTSTPIEIAARDTINIHTNYETSVKRNSNKQPPIFGEESVAEEDLRISESLNSEYEKSSNKVGLREEVFPNKNVNRKVVRFAQAVNEIPLTESGVWSATEDHT